MKKNVVVIKHENKHAVISYSIQKMQTFNQALYLTIEKSSFKCKSIVKYNPSIV